MLIDQEGKIDILSEEHRPPLWIACAREEIDMVQCLLDKGADVNMRFRSHVSPFDAIKYSDEFSWPGIARLLLEHGADVGRIKVDSKKIFALKIAQREGLTPVADAVLSALRIERALSIGISMLDAEVIEFLLRTGSVSRDLQSIGLEKLLMDACECKAISVVQFLLNTGLEVLRLKQDNHRLAVLQAALVTGDDAVVQQISLHMDQQKALELACKWALYDAVQFFIERGVDVNKGNESLEVPLWLHVRLLMTRPLQKLSNCCLGAALVHRARGQEPWSSPVQTLSGGNGIGKPFSCCGIGVQTSPNCRPTNSFG